PKLLLSSQRTDLQIYKNYALIYASLTKADLVGAAEVGNFSFLINPIKNAGKHSGIFYFLHIVSKNLCSDQNTLPHKKAIRLSNSDSAFICYLCPSATAIKTSIGSY
ncbi:MAG: hypothetical protein M0P50_11365, partial [Bacteroidales bacterium]|nr:hypothetical protein [Bacteroidales bacterium]